MLDQNLLSLVKSELKIDIQNDHLNEDELILLIEDRVKYYLDNEKELLVSYLYRLDIPQAQVNAVMRLTNVIPPEKSLAMLIYKRQLERIATKKKYKQKPIEGWEF